MATVHVSFTSQSTGAVQKQANIDNVNLTFDQNGHASMQVTKGSHVLEWFIKGRVGTTYAIAITAPPEAVWAHPATTLGAGGKDAGLKQFSVNS
jgi:hypothetical protein